MKSIYTFILLFIFTQEGFSQCPSGSISLTSQQQIDNFSANYPNCTELQGYLCIGACGNNIPNSDITNLNGLSVITSTTDRISLRYLSNLSDISGLGNLTTVGKELLFIHVEALEDFTGVGDIIITKEFGVFNCDALTSLTGINILSTSVIAIQHNPNLTDISSLSSVNMLEGQLVIENNDLLTNLNGLENTTTLNPPGPSFILIKGNAILSDISAIQNIDAASINSNWPFPDLQIFNNPLLAICDYPNLCSFLDLASTDPNLDANITNNAPGCNSIAEVEAACNSCDLTLTPTITHTTCNQDNGAIDITASNTNETITYTLNGSAQIFPVTGLSPGSYEIIGEDPSMCKDTIFVTIDDSFSVIMDVQSTGTTCGENNGTITPTIILSNGPVTYTINGQLATLPFENLAPGNYTIEATDEDGCTASEVVTINSSQDIDVTFIPTHTVCNEDNGGISVTETYANGTVTYTVDGAISTMPVTGLSSGTYAIVASDSDGCSYSEMVTVAPSNGVGITYSSTPTTCDQSNGTIAASIDEGNGNVTYTIDGADATIPITNLGVSIYTLVATDDDNCSETQMIEVEATTPLEFTLSSTSTSCGQDNGSVDVTLVSEAEPVIYSINGQAVTFPLSGQAPGTYTVDGIDANNCPKSVMFTIEASQDIDISLTPTATLCGLANGEISVTETYANGTVSYTLDGSPTSMPITGLSSGTYEVVATDSDGCSYTEMVTIDGSQDIELTFTPTHTTCGMANGGLTANVTFVNGSITYTIDGSTVSLPLAQMGAGTYEVVATDSDGCSYTEMITIEGSQDLDVNFDITHTSCGLSNGEITASESFANGIVIYTLDGSPTSMPVTGLSAGVYEVVATDSDGCSYTEMVTIDGSQDIDISLTPTATLCGLANGEISVTETFANGTVSYTLDGSPTSMPITGLSSGIYEVMATDSDGCSHTDMVTIDGSQDIELSFTPTHTTCGMANGGLTVNVSFVNGSISYTLDGSAVSLPLAQMAAGTYEVVATDSDGCSYTEMVTIEDSEELVVTAGHPSGSITTKCNEDNGVVYIYNNATPTQNLNITDANGPIIYQKLCVYLAPSGQACIVSDLPPGMYNWTCTDGNGCVDQVSFTVEESDPLDITATPTATSCDLVNGEVSFTINTGTAPITYSENGTDVTDFTGLAAGDYSWDAEDAIGCLYVVDFTIDPSIEATFTTTPTHTFCDGNNGSVTATMTSGTDFLTYTLNGLVNTTGVYNNLAPGTYTMTAVDNVFCPASSTFTINGSDPLEITTVVTPTFCNEDNGSITATLDSGTSPVEYTIAGQGTNTTGAFTDLAPGTYTLNAEDAVGCEATETFTIDPSDPLDINTVINHTTCELDNGSLISTLTSGTAPVTYTISGLGSNTTGQFTDLAPGNYTMNAIDATGCQASVVLIIEDSTLPLFTMDVVRTSCGDANGSIQLTPDVNTGRAPYDFNIGNGWTSDYTFNDLVPDDYIVTVRDADGCMTSQNATILESEQLVFINHIDHADCNNITGIITLIALEGTGPFLYSISNEYIYRKNTFGTFSFVEAGQYSATVIGEDGCVVTQNLTVENDPGVILNVDVNHPDCGETNGSVQFNLGRTGTAPYQIIVDGVLVKDSLYADYLISNLANGDYKVEVVDFYGCNDYAEITINDGNSIVEDMVINNIGCEGELGSVSTVIGASGYYTFTLNGETNNDGSFSGLEAGRYTYTATDSMGCDFTKEIGISNNSFTDVRILVINDDCEDLSNIKIIPENGKGPYRYFVNGKQYFENGANDLPQGFYTVEVIDANGCTVIQEIKVEGESKFTYSIEKCRKPRFGQPGFIVVQAIGGEGPYRYKLDEYTNSKGLFVNLYKETYTLTITDSRGCSSSFEVKLCGEDTPGKNLPILRSDNKLSDITVFPNPGDKVLNIAHGSLVDNEKIEIYSSTGQLIKLIPINQESELTTVSTQEWSKGIYFIKIGPIRMIKWFKM